MQKLSQERSIMCRVLRAQLYDQNWAIILALFFPSQCDLGHRNVASSSLKEDTVFTPSTAVWIK